MFPPLLCVYASLMRLFQDTANIDEIHEAVRLGAISGVATNSFLASNEGIGPLSGYMDVMLESRSPYRNRAVSSANLDVPTPVYRSGAVKISKGLGGRCGIAAR